YLKLLRRIDDNTVEARYMHTQSYGFRWAVPGDTVATIRSSVMENIGGLLTVKSIEPIDAPTEKGAKDFRITFNEPLDPAVDPANEVFGIENLTATPSVYFADNIIRNNRARGALFSTPRKVVVEHNLFDHTSGSAILLCGDCNGWFETGACTDVTIRKNSFINALTNLFQFTNAVISIYPEIPDLEGQTKYFHSNVTNTDNLFNTFDAPLLYAKSVKGLTFMGNTVIRNNDFPTLHWNQSPVWLQRVDDARIQATSGQ
ncbi:MAG: alpha-1,3-galactosidase B, partial [Paramuribaculum sp.]